MRGRFKDSSGTTADPESLRMTSTTMSLTTESVSTYESTTVTTTTTTVATEEKEKNASTEVAEEDFGVKREISDCNAAYVKPRGLGFCTGNSTLTELILILMIITNVLMALCSPIILAIERVRVEKMVKEYWESKRLKELRRRDQRERELRERQENENDSKEKKDDRENVEMTDGQVV